MNVLIDGTSIGAHAEVTGAQVTDCAGGRADSCMITLRGGDALVGWGLGDAVQAGSLSVELEDGGFTTGTMTLQSVESRNGDTILHATSLPHEAREAGWDCFEQVTLGGLLHLGAQRMGLKGAKLYGIKEQTLLRRVVRRNVSWPEFLEHTMRLEGGTVKLEDGYLLAFDLRTLFSGIMDEVQLDAQERPKLFIRPKCRFLTVRSGLISARAEDTAVAGSASKTVTDEQIYSHEQAMRAARGLLLMRNLESEVYTREIELDTGIAAMSRVYVRGGGEAGGKWFVARCTHDFVRRSTFLDMRRCLMTVRV